MGGKVVARAADGSGDLTGPGILRFLKKNVEAEGSLLITDEYKGYNAASSLFRHAVIKHKERYVDGNTHTHTIEGFWSLVKRAWYGTHHKYSRQHLPLFIAESCWKYNNRKNSNAFGTFLQGAIA